MIHQYCNRYEDTLFERVDENMNLLVFEFHISPNRIGTEAEKQYKDLINIFSKHCMSKDENNISYYAYRFYKFMILVAKV